MAAAPPIVHDELLHALAAGLLEPGDELALLRAISARPPLAARWAAARRGERPAPRLAPLATNAPARGWSAHVGHDAVFQSSAPRPGDRVVVLLDATLPPELRLVLLDVRGAAPRALHPVPGAPWRTLGDLPLRDGQRALELVAPEGGAQWELLALPPADAEPPGADHDWTDARLRARDGELPGWSLELSTE